ncbi:MAG: right-handed parallel beta-helix repeat-containing protein [Kofleriaceae bacterium]
MWLGALVVGLGGCGLGSVEREPEPLANLFTATATPVDYTIEAGQAFTIDRSYDVGHLTIHGKLFCSREATGLITITATTITVDGPGALFECGNEAQRYGGQISFLLRDEGGRHAAHGHAEASLSVSGGGTLRLFGDRVANFGWQRVGAEVAAGATSLRLEKAVAWQVGDQVVVGPTGFDFAEAEERTITALSADGLTVSVSAPFTYRHGAFTQLYTEGNRRAVLDQRAEVANLTRNIVISTAGDLATMSQTKRGAGVVIRHGGKAFVDGVELSRGGKLGVMGEYPFHWHLAGDVPGQFLRNSSLHHTFQRCVTLHGTNYAEVSNNVCFDHLGHGFFFEQGNEVKNVLRGNLGMRSRRVEAGQGLLDSDMRSEQTQRFSAPATFWVTNPDNELSGNVASGSEGTGFWMAFSQGIRCGTAASPYACDGPAGASNNVFPARQDTLRFSNNLAHAAVVGITWDGAEDGAPSELAKAPGARKTVSTHYHHGAATPVFDGLQVWKNVATGVYFRGNAATFRGLLAADNGRSLFFAYNQKVEGGLVVGASGGLTAADLAYGQSRSPDIRLYYFAGALIYDGPFELQDVHFADFQARGGVPAVPFLNIGGANRSVNRVRHVTFAGPMSTRVALNGERTWSDTPWTTAVRDDGSLTGAPGLLVPDHPMNVSAGECARVSATVADAGWSCQYRWGVLFFAESRFRAPYDAIRVPIKFERIEQATGAVVASDPLRPEQLTNKSGMIVGLRYRYRLSLSQPDAVPELVRMIWQPEDGSLSPILEIDGVAANRCRPSRAGAELPSLAALNTATATAYRWENGNLYMRVSAGADDLVCL